MMAKFVYFFIAALAFSAVLAAPKKATAEKTVLEQLVENAETVRKDFEASLQKVLPGNKELDKVLLDVSKSFAVTVEKGTKELTDQAAKNKPVLDNIVKDASAKITESIAFLKGLAGDDVTKKGEEVRQNVESHLKTILTEGKKIETAIKPNIEHVQANVKQFATTLFQELATAGERLKADIDKALAAKQ